MAPAGCAGTLGLMAPRTHYAGFWLRLAAYLMDLKLIYIVDGVLAVGGLLMGPREISIVGILVGLINFALVSAAPACAYFALFFSSPPRGTPAKITSRISLTAIP